MKFIKEKRAGNIFLIPLYLPAYQTWRDREDFINYGTYKFNEDDNYVFGRVIDIRENGSELIEVFRYFGKLPTTSLVITTSGRLFEPVYTALPFDKKRWPFIFADDKYDKFSDSDYENISFLYINELWRGGKKSYISIEEQQAYKEAGISYVQIYTGVQLEERIRLALKSVGIELDYEQIVEQRKLTFPVPRKADESLKKKLSPFIWSIGSYNNFNLFLSAGGFKTEAFMKNGLSGNGYDWEKLFLYFLEKNMPYAIEKISCDSEAGIFSILSSDKKCLQSLALQFRSFCDCENEFQLALSNLKPELK